MQAESRTPEKTAIIKTHFPPESMCESVEHIFKETEQKVNCSIYGDLLAWKKNLYA